MLNLFMARTIARKTQYDLSLETGIPQSKLSLLERGYIRPKEKEKRSIANALALRAEDIDWLEKKEMSCA